MAAGAYAAQPLAPIRSTMRAMAAHPGLPPLAGLARNLTVSAGLASTTRHNGSARAIRSHWVPATMLVSGEAVDDFIGAATDHWHTAPHVAAALAWRQYTYWLSLPAVLGFVTARRVPLVRPDGVVVRWSVRPPFIRVGLTTVDVAVLAEDRLAQTANGGVQVVPDERALLAALRSSLVESHLSPMVEHLRDRVQLGRRGLWGSLASGVANAMARASTVVPGVTTELTTRVLSALEVADLVELTPGADGRLGCEIRRATCCLAFKLPTPKICTDCCLR